jgi:hypothetical protein
VDVEAIRIGVRVLPGDEMPVAGRIRVTRYGRQLPAEDDVRPWAVFADGPPDAATQRAILQPRRLRSYNGR